jgi:acetyl-CoA acetyltransferase
MNRHALITGVGNTPYRKKAEAPADVLALRAVLAACRDAGIDPGAIDGMINYPGHAAEDVVLSNLPIPRMRFRATVDQGGASAVSGLRTAGLAVLGGAATHVLLLRGLLGSSGLRKAERPSFLPGRNLRLQLEHTAGWNTPAARYAVLAQRYRHEYGLERATLAEIALAARAHAQLNPDAQMFGRPLTLEEYMGARLVADPYHLFDCCLETDGASAVIVSATPACGARRAVKLLGAAEAVGASPIDISNRDPFLSIGLDHAAADVWAQTGLGPADMDAAMIYDCFTFEVLHQLESAGFAPHGRGRDLVADGQIRLGGRLPVNTHGGMLSEGHQAGLNHVIEAVRQLRGEAGARQVADARLIAVSGWGQLGDGSFCVLEAGNG